MVFSGLEIVYLVEKPPLHVKGALKSEKSSIKWKILEKDAKIDK